MTEASESRRPDMPLAAADSYALCPVFSIATICFTGLMVLYPFYLLYVLGEGHKDMLPPFNCNTYYGVWRIIHISHLLLWSMLMALAIICYPRRLDRDLELGEYHYVLVGFAIRVPFDRIIEVKTIVGGYVKMSASSLPFPLCFRPSAGADGFLRDHEALMASLEGQKPSGYGATAVQARLQSTAETLQSGAAAASAAAASLAATAAAASEGSSGGAAAPAAAPAPAVARLAASDGSSGGTPFEGSEAPAVSNG